MVFYHTSPHKIPFGTRLESRRGYVCLSTTLLQALYWAAALAKDRKNATTWYIYHVHVRDEAMVEDCRAHYHAEYPGQRKRAREVLPHHDWDGEVVVHSPEPVTVLSPLLLLGPQEIALMDEFLRLTFWISEVEWEIEHAHAGAKHRKLLEVLKRRRAEIFRYLLFRAAGATP